MSPDDFRRLVAAGLTTEQIAVVMDMMSRDAKAIADAEEDRKAKGRERWHRWNDKRKPNVSKHEQTLANDSRGDARGEDNLLTKNQAGKKKQETIGACAPERDFFADFWLAYPRREGPNPKKPAKDRFLRLVAKGHDPDTIIASAKAFAAENPTPTRFIPQAITWLSQERFDDEAPVMKGDEFCPDEWMNTRFLVLRYRNEHSGNDPPRAVHGGKAGYLIPAEWVAVSKQQQVANA